MVVLYSIASLAENQTAKGMCRSIVMCQIPNIINDRGNVWPVCPADGGSLKV